MALAEDIKAVFSECPGEFKESGGKIKFSYLVAERRVFWFMKSKLEYKAEFRVDDAAKEVTFSELLKESGFGVSGGGGFSDGDMGMSPGFGFKKETYNTLSGAREGTIEEQSKIFGQKYEYKFDYGKIRKEVEAVAKKAGYQFTYKIFGA
jgi:hypothetical protein